MNEQLRPGCSHELVFGDQFPSTFNQGGEDCQGACSEVDRSAIPEKELSRGDQTELSERERPIGLVES
jgi:hypothetical protein